MGDLDSILDAVAAIARPLAAQLQILWPTAAERPPQRDAEAEAAAARSAWQQAVQQYVQQHGQHEQLRQFQARVAEVREAGEAASSSAASVRRQTAYANLTYRLASELETAPSLIQVAQLHSWQYPGSRQQFPELRTQLAAAAACLLPLQSVTHLPAFSSASTVPAPLLFLGSEAATDADSSASNRGRFHQEWADRESRLVSGSAGQQQLSPPPMALPMVKMGYRIFRHSAHAAHRLARL